MLSQRRLLNTIEDTILNETYRGLLYLTSTLEQIVLICQSSNWHERLPGVSLICSTNVLSRVGLSNVLIANTTNKNILYAVY